MQRNTRRTRSPATGSAADDGGDDDPEKHDENQGAATGHEELAGRVPGSPLALEGAGVVTFPGQTFRRFPLCHVSSVTRSLRRERPGSPGTAGGGIGAACESETAWEWREDTESVFGGQSRALFCIQSERRDLDFCDPRGLRVFLRESRQGVGFGRRAGTVRSNPRIPWFRRLP